MPRARILDSSIQAKAREGIMTLRLTHLRFAAVALAIATVPLAAAPARAFTIENQGATNSDGSPKFADPDDQVNNFGSGVHMFGRNGPAVQFGAQPRSSFGPLNGYQGGANAIPPDPYGPRSLGNND
jgi:hypothetical protein